ncbi:hypothetical protein BKG85_04965 [Mycobacteroides chelonae]|nr:hypothetical protein BKG85_04965 [Mycobacteroides chelonae]
MVRKISEEICLAYVNSNRLVVAGEFGGIRMAVAQRRNSLQKSSIDGSYCGGAAARDLVTIGGERVSTAVPERSNGLLCDAVALGASTLYG